ncbi:vWA domain-containing protein [Parazoarcus communis]|nr:VWA domain-containing protein [Parazoarcus communis]
MARQTGARIDWLRTLVAKGPAMLARQHLRHRPPPAGGATLYCLLLDCSASMLRSRRLALAKGLLLEWAAERYRRREPFAVIGFGGKGARVLQAPRKAVAFNERWIAPIAGGGGSPADAAVALADQLLARRRRSKPDERFVVCLLSDVRFTALPPRPQQADHCTIIDFDEGPLALGRARQLARAWQADHRSAAELVSACA